MARKALEETTSLTPLTGKECEDLIIQLHTAGHQTAQIGIMLRDTHGIKSVKELTGKRVQEILEERNVKMEIPEDLMNLLRTSVQLEQHLTKHKHDMTAKRGFELTVSKIRRLANYYLEKGKLPATWRYTAQMARLLVK